MTEHERAVIEAATVMYRDWEAKHAATDEHVADLYFAVAVLIGDLDGA